MSEADAAARRLEARVGKRFVEVLRAFVGAEIRRNPATASVKSGVVRGGPCRVARPATYGT
jgi:hypothetical protein